MNSAQFGQGIKVAETDKLNIDSIIARLLEGKEFLGFFLFYFSKSSSKSIQRKLPLLNSSQE